MRIRSGAVARRVGAMSVGLSLLVVGCSSGGDSPPNVPSPDGGGATPAQVADGGSPPTTGNAGADITARCLDFLKKEKGCFDAAGTKVTLNPEACNDVPADLATTIAMYDCAEQFPVGLCHSIAPPGGGPSGADPDARAYDGCRAEKRTVAPCKDAIHALTACGGVTTFSPACSAQEQITARCVLAHPSEACAALGGSTAKPSTAFVQCVQAGGP